MNTNQKNLAEPKKREKFRRQLQAKYVKTSH